MSFDFLESKQLSNFFYVDIHQITCLRLVSIDIANHALMRLLSKIRFVYLVVEQESKQNKNALTFS